MRFSVKLAGEVFTLETLYENTCALCKDYLCEEEGRVITITEADITLERELTIREAKLEHRRPEVFSPGVLETTAVYRKMADWFSHHDSAVVHGALIALNGEGYLFTAPSGTGKTTHIMNWLKVYSEAQVINGDKPILRIEGDRVIACGTPWSGKERMNINSSVPLKAVISLYRAEENSIEKVPLGEVLGKLSSAVYRAKDGEGPKRALQFLLGMNGKVGFYRLGCNMEEESARVAFEGMQEE